jgi:hypothetical protein
MLYARLLSPDDFDFPALFALLAVCSLRMRTSAWRMTSACKRSIITALAMSIHQQWRPSMQSEWWLHNVEVQEQAALEYDTSSWVSHLSCS